MFFLFLLEKGTVALGDSPFGFALAIGFNFVVIDKGNLILFHNPSLHQNRINDSCKEEGWHDGSRIREDSRQTGPSERVENQQICSETCAHCDQSRRVPALGILIAFVDTEEFSDPEPAFADKEEIKYNDGRIDSGYQADKGVDVADHVIDRVIEHKQYRHHRNQQSRNPAEPGHPAFDGDGLRINQRSYRSDIGDGKEHQTYGSQESQTRVFADLYEPDGRVIFSDGKGGESGE